MEESGGRCNPANTAASNGMFQGCLAHHRQGLGSVFVHIALEATPRIGHAGRILRGQQPNYPFAQALRAGVLVTIESVTSGASTAR